MGCPQLKITDYFHRTDDTNSLNHYNLSANTGKKTHKRFFTSLSLRGEDALIAETSSTGTYLAMQDGNKNIVGYIDSSDGTSVADYEYSPFGKLIVSTGTMADDFAFKFSSYYTDDETGLVYYGYRYYDADMGRWLNRDPIGESGGNNLYGFVGNNPMKYIDLLGLVWLYGTGKDSTHFQLLARDQNMKPYPASPDGKTIPEEVLAKAGNRLYGPVDIGTDTVKAFSKQNFINEIRSSNVNHINIVAHGNALEIEDVSYSDIIGVKAGNYHSSITTYSCELGDEALRWSKALRIPISASKVRHKFQIEMYVQPKNGATPQDTKVFGDLLNKVKANSIDYAKFVSDWKTASKKLIKEKKICNAYWDTNYSTYDRNTWHPFNPAIHEIRNPVTGDIDGYAPTEFELEDMMKPPMVVPPLPPSLPSSIRTWRK